MLLFGNYDAACFNAHMPNVLTHALVNKSDVMRKAVLLFVCSVILVGCKKQPTVAGNDAPLPAMTTVTSPELKMRISPNTTAVEIARLVRGEQVRIVQRSADSVQVGKLNAYWYKVTNASGLTGWVYGAHLAIESDEGDAKAAAEEADKKLKAALIGRWDAAKPTGALTANFVTLQPDGQIEFGSNRKGLQYGKYTIEIKDGIAHVNVTDIKKPMMTDIKAKIVGETLVFTALMDNNEYKLNLSEKDAQMFKDQDKKKAAEGTPGTGTP